MAPRAVERIHMIWAELAFLLEPRPGRVAFALRLALICAVTAAVAEIYQTPDAALTIYIAFFLNKSDRAGSLIASFALLFAFTTVIGVILLTATVVLDNPMWRVGAMVAWSVIFLFVVAGSKLRPLSGPLALIVGYALAELGSVPAGEVATRGLLYVWLLVGIPAGVSVVINLLFAYSPRRLVELAIANSIRLTAQMLRDPDQATRHRFAEALRDNALSLPNWLKLATVEHTLPGNELLSLKGAANATLMLMAAVDVIDRYARASTTEVIREPIARMLDKIASMLHGGGYPTNTSFRIALSQTSDEVTSRAFAAIENAINGFAVPSAVSDADQTPPPRDGFFAHDALTNPDYLRYAMKTTAAAMTCYFLYTLLDWPGIHTCFITCYIVVLGTTAESVEKLGLRLIGCLVGASAGLASIVYLLPAMTSLSGLMTVVFLGAVVAAYVAAGSQRIAYAGFQIALAFFLCVVQGDAPAFDLKTARDRVIGILVGNLVSYLILSTVWPASVAKRIDPAIVSLLQRLGLIPTADTGARTQNFQDAMAQLSALEADLQLARYEPSHLGASRAWLVARRKTTRAVAALLGPLFLLERREAIAIEATMRLDAVSTSVFDKPQPRRSTTPPQGQLAAIIDQGLSKVEHSVAPSENSRYARA